MRVISQDGTVVFPYEKAVLYVEYESVIAKVGDERCVIGIYSTEEKAVKAMEMLRERYENNEFYHHTAATDTFNRTMRLLSIEKFKKATSEYFQFPQDDEIEVRA